jgi:RND superfamily putative drug exporter
MSSMLYAFGRLAHRRWRVVLLVWVLVLGAAGGAAAVLGEGTTDSFTIPGTESQEALDRLAVTFPQASGASAQVVAVASDGDVTDETGAVAEVVAALEGLDGTAAVAPVLAEDGTLLPDAQVSEDGDTLLVVVQLDAAVGTTLDEVTGDLLAVVQEATSEQVRWTVGGDAFQPAGASLTPTSSSGSWSRRWC